MLARSLGYGRRPPCPIRLVRRIPARTPIRIKPLDDFAIAASALASADLPLLNAVGVAVSDMQEALRFFRLLGVDLPEAQDGHVHGVLPSGVLLMLDTEDVVRSFLPEWKSEGANRVSLAFECGDPAEVDAVYARVAAAGFPGEREPWDAAWGQRYAVLAGPGGLRVSLYASL